MYPMRNAAFVMALTACGGSGEWVVPTPAAEDVGPRVRIEGVIRHLGLEGGFYAIRGSDSVTYDPTNLPAEFRKDGLEVEAEARRRDDVMGVHQVGPIVQLERIRLRGKHAEAAVSAPLQGSWWVLEDLAGAGVVEPGRATLAFEEAGRASGKGSCNRFSGPVTISGDKISFGPLLSTKMACAEAPLMAQEARYLSALGNAERYTVEGTTLRIHVKGGGEPLRFSRTTSP